MSVKKFSSILNYKLFPYLPYFWFKEDIVYYIP